MDRPRVIVLGAGPAGLGAAYRLARDRQANVVILERHTQVGGNAGSFEFGGQKLDFGSHRLHPSCEPEILGDIRRLLGADLLRRPRHGRIRLRGRWIHFPPKPLDLLLRLDRRFAIGVAGDMLRGALPQRRRRGENREETFAEVLRPRLGSTICEQFYFPYAQKIWGRPAEELSAIQARRRVSAGTFKRLLRKVLGGLPGVKPLGFDYFYYPRQGFGQISDAFADAAVGSGAEIALGETVERLEAPRARGDQWTVHTRTAGGHREYQAEFVWSTLPITAAMRMLAPPPAPEVAAAAERIHYRAMILVYLQLPVPSFSDYDAHYFPGADTPLTRLSEPKIYSGVAEPWDSTVLCAELPCDRADRLWQLDDRELGELVAEALERCELPLPGPPIEVITRRLPQAYPIYTTGYEESLELLDSWASGLPRFLTFGRQGLFAHDNTHHALYMAYCAADCLSAEGFDHRRWARYREIFESHVVED